MKTFHVRKLLLFNVLSLSDLWLTWILIRHSEGQVYESNPIASALLGSYGWPGLAAYKVATILMVGCACIFISQYRPRLSGRILLFACSTTGLVVLYSCSLLGYTGLP